MATVTIIGAGGLGNPVLLALARAGHRLRVVDDDVTDLSNLPRQLLYRERELGERKVVAAARRLRALVPSCEVEPIVGRFDRESADRLLEDAALLIDGSDDFATRFFANDECVRRSLPLVHGAVLGFSGQVLVVLPGRSACYRCLFEAPPAPGSIPSCAEAGVLGSVCGVVGARMAQAAIDVLEGKARGGELFVYDAQTARPRIVRVGRDPSCASCGAPREGALYASEDQP